MEHWSPRAWRLISPGGFCSAPCATPVSAVSRVQGRALVAEMAALREDAATKAASLAEAQKRHAVQRLEIAEIKVRPPRGTLL